MCVPGGHRKRAGRGVSYSWRVIKIHEQRAGRQIAAIKSLTRDAMKEYNLKSLIGAGDYRRQESLYRGIR